MQGTLSWHGREATSLVLRLGQLCGGRAAVPCQGGCVFLSRFGGEGDAAASAPFGLCLGHLLSGTVLYRERACHMAAFLVVGLKGHPVCRSGHQMAALGIEGHRSLGALLLLLEHAAHGAQGHVGRVVARCQGFVVDGEHTAVQLVIVQIVLLAHLFAEEPPFGILRVGMFIGTPVELPAGIGPQFVESAVERVGEAERAVPLSVLHLQQLSLHQIAVLIEQLRIQYAAYLAGCACVGAPEVGLVVDGIAQIVAGVVHVDEDLFLWQGLSEFLQPFGPPFQCGGGRGCLSAGTDGQEPDHCGGEYTIFYGLFHFLSQILCKFTKKI